MQKVCTSRPDCPCAFCVRVRTAPSERDKQDNLAREWVVRYIEHFTGVSPREDS